MPKNDIPHILNRFNLNGIFQSFVKLIAAITENMLIHHNIEFELHSGFNATEKNTTMTK